tara:strand:+ start:594 stop:842 length:249 start_codon:yes stop_codon:yes gene_type:complete
MSDRKLEELISELVVEIMLDAHEQGISLKFSDICKMVGIPEDSIDNSTETDEYFMINEEFVAAIRDKDMRKSMIERLFATVH